MNILIIGCGKVGTELATQLDNKGHDVCVIDRSGERFELLPASFSGFTYEGVPIDRELLERSGIESCDALCAVASDDDVNIMVAQIAAKIYNVPKVFARVTDNEKCEMFEKMGIRTICPTNLIASAVCTALEEEACTVTNINFENHTVSFTEMDVPEEFLQLTPDEIEYEPDEVLFGIIREGFGFIFYTGQPMNFIPKDKLIFAKKV